MKLTTVFLLYLVQAVYSDELYDDFTKIECSSSGKTCVDPFCYLNEHHKLNNSISFGCDLQRSLSPVYFHIRFYSIEDGEENLVTDKKVNFCEVNDHPENFNFQLLGHVKFMEITFPGLVKECPYNEIKVINGTRHFYNYYWPNGEYKTITTIMDDQDDKIFEVIYYEDLKSRPENYKLEILHNSK